METLKDYKVEITSKGKLHYFEVLEYFYGYMSYESATRNSEELYDSTYSLRNLPERGQLELTLQHLNKEHRYLLYHSTSRRAIKALLVRVCNAYCYESLNRSGLLFYVSAESCTATVLLAEIISSSTN